MRLYIMLMLMLPCLAMAQGQAGLYRLMAGAVSGGDDGFYGIPTDGLVAFWYFSESLDASDHWSTHDCTEVGTGSFSTNGYDTADGTAYLKTGVTNATGTIFGWVKYDAMISDANVLIGAYVGYNTRKYLGLWSINGKLGASVGNISYSTFAVADYTLGNWAFLCVTWGSGTATYYVNGEFVKSAAYSITPSSDEYYIGICNRAPTWESDATIDACGVYSRAIASNEVYQIYEATQK